MNYREKMREYIKCPQFSSIDYGKWGSLNLEQRKLIKRLLDEMYRADEVIKKQFFELNKQKEILDNIKEYCKNKIEEQKNMTDFSKYYLENYDKAINTQHLSHSGIMLETIKSTTIKRYEDILELLKGDK